MGQSGDTHQVGKGSGLGVQKHLHGEFGAELRNPEVSEGPAVDVVRRDAKGRRILEQRHHLLVIQGDLRGIQSGQVLQHTDHGGIIVSQNVQLQQVMVNGVVVKVGGHRIRGHIVRGMLHRGKGVDLLSQRQHNDAARMLSGASSDSRTARDDPVNLTGTFLIATLLVIIFHVAKGGLIRQRGDGSGAEGLSGAEDYLRIFMGLTLVFTGEVQVDIRLLVALEAEEGFKGNVKAVLFQQFSADRAVFVRHVAARPARIGLHLRGIKIAVMAFHTVIVRA